MRLEQIRWKESIGSHSIECKVEIAIQASKSNVIFLIVPGVDGSLDGYQNKYLKIAEEIFTRQSVACIRMTNPFISSNHWDKNLRITLEYILDHLSEICS